MLVIPTDEEFELAKAALACLHLTSEQRGENHDSQDHGRTRARRHGTTIRSRNRHSNGPLSAEELRLIDAYWRAANYLCGRPDLPARQSAALASAYARGHQAASARPLGHDAGTQLHLRASEPGHQGARPGHDHGHRPGSRRSGNRRQHVARGHVQRALRGRLARRRRAWLGCSSSSRSQAEFRVTARRRCPGSIHEGGELGYSLSHAFGAAFDNPDLIVTCVVGDGEAETGPLATVVALQQVPQPGDRRRGPADPASQRLQDRQSHRAGAHPARGPRVAPRRLRLAAVLRQRRPARARCTRRWRPRWTACIDEIHEIQATCRARESAQTRALADDRAAEPEGLDRAQLRSTATRSRVRGARIRCRSTACATNPEHLRAARGSGCASYDPASLFDENGAPIAELRALAPVGQRRIGDNPHANGGLLRRDLQHAGLRRLRRAGPRARARTAEAARARSAGSCAT